MSDYYPAPEDALPLFRAAGEQAARACEARAVRETAFDPQEAGRVILECLRTGGPQTGEQLVDACASAGITPHDPRAFGPVIGRLARAGAIRSIGVAARRKGHGTAGARVWALT